MIFFDELPKAILLFLSFAGLVVSIFSILEKHVEWVASFCAYFGEGCRKTEDFTLFRIPIAWWGAFFYIVLAAAILIAEPLVFWIVMAAVGMELTFIWIIITIRASCIFCIFNAFVVAGLVLFTLDPARIWQAISAVLVFFVISKYLLYVENVSEISGEREGEKPNILARLNEEQITAAEVERPLADRIHKLELKIYRMKLKRLQRMIRKRLMEKEAQHQGVTLKELRESIQSDVEVSDEEIEHYYRENQDKWKDWQEPEDELKRRIRDILRNKKYNKAVEEYADSLKDRYDVAVFLKEPPLPLTRVRVEDNPATGPENAPVTIVEFSDYLCPACRAAHEAATQIRESYRGKIRWIFKDFPLEQHKGAKKMAKAAHCAREQRKFWKYQDKLFASEGKPDQEMLKNYASELALDPNRFEHCIKSDKYLENIEEDIEDGRDAGISATPTFIINGKMKSGSLSFDDFKNLIEDELKKT